MDNIEKLVINVFLKFTGGEKNEQIGTDGELN